MCKTNKNKVDDHVNMYVLYAKFFSIVAKKLEKKYGQEGLLLLEECVNEWGEARGKNIAKRAAQNGHTNDLQSYLPNYDMERSNLFGYETQYAEDEINQDFTRCVFAETWIEAGEEKYGRIYCDNIDPAICRGYNENLECRHEQIMYKDGHCTFTFKMKDNN